MEADKLTDERDRKHAIKAERRNRAITYHRKDGWRWPEPDLQTTERCIDADPRPMRVRERKKKQ
jgi:hypothetical protein